MTLMRSLRSPVRSAVALVLCGGRNGQSFRFAGTNSDMVEQRLRDRTRLVESDVKEAFFAALARRARRDLRQRIEQLNRRMRDASKARVDAGESPVMEFNLAEIRLGESRKQTIAAEHDYAIALLALEHLLNTAPDTPVELGGELRAAAVPCVLADLLIRAREARPDLLASRREVAEPSTGCTSHRCRRWASIAC